MKDLEINKRKFYSKPKRSYNNYRRTGGDFPENRRAGLGIEVDDETSKKQKSVFKEYITKAMNFVSGLTTVEEESLIHKQSNEEFKKE